MGAFGFQDSGSQFNSAFRARTAINPPHLEISSHMQLPLMQSIQEFPSSHCGGFQGVIE
jgi:hypothetical protein